MGDAELDLPDVAQNFVRSAQEALAKRRGRVSLALFLRPFDLSDLLFRFAPRQQWLGKWPTSASVGTTTINYYPIKSHQPEAMRPCQQFNKLSSVGDVQ